MKEISQSNRDQSGLLLLDLDLESSVLGGALHGEVPWPEPEDLTSQASARSGTFRRTASVAIVCLVPSKSLTPWMSTDAAALIHLYVEPETIGPEILSNVVDGCPNRVPCRESSRRRESGTSSNEAKASGPW